MAGPSGETIFVHTGPAAKAAGLQFGFAAVAAFERVPVKDRAAIAAKSRRGGG